MGFLLLIRGYCQANWTEKKGKDKTNRRKDQRGFPPTLAGPVKSAA